jgi:predicted RNA-binding protein associated with RNAse of E/G family
MLKKRYGDRSDWKRIVKREYLQSYMETEEFTGTISRLNIVQVKEPLWVHYDDKSICIVDNGYTWVQHFPVREKYTLTTMFDSNGEIVQWYIDICNEIGIENNVPWWEDLFLDIVVLATGEIILLDEDELEEALEDGSIDQKMYDLAWTEANRIILLIREQKFPLLHINKISEEE